MARRANTPPLSGDKDVTGPKPTGKAFYVGEDRYCKKIKGKEYWYYRYRCAKDGQTIIIQDKTLSGLREKESPIFDALASGVDISKAKSVTMQSLFDSWIAKKPKQTTRKGRKTAINTIVRYKTNWEVSVKDTFGAVAISDVKKNDIVDFFYALSGSSKSKLKLIKTILNNIFKEAKLQELISENLMQDVAVVEAIKDLGENPRGRDALSKDEQARFMTAMLDKSEKDITWHICNVLLRTGLRIGELSGLTSDNLNLSSLYLKVTQQVQNNDETNVLYVCPPKTPKGVRTVYFDEDCKASFEYIISKGYNSPTISGQSRFVALLGDDTVVTSHALYGRIHRRIESYNKKHPDLPPLRMVSPHLLRHTYGTRAAEEGINPKVLQFLMGHETLSMTMDLYVNAFDDAVIEAEARKIKI